GFGDVIFNRSRYSRMVRLLTCFMLNLLSFGEGIGPWQWFEWFEWGYVGFRFALPNLRFTVLMALLM
ncbi:MAG: hypothetical protein Q9M09_00400, partial [Mariprofundaceae bacterium]|nr:hypothetical protein [Mariprofundaceae bacterium]